MGNSENKVGNKMENKLNKIRIQKEKLEIKSINERIKREEEQRKEKLKYELNIFIHSNDDISLSLKNSLNNFNKDIYAWKFELF